MSYTQQQLWDLLQDGYRMPFGAAQIAVAEQVTAHADALHEPQLQFTARMFAVRAYIYGGEPGKAFVPFSWCVAEHDKDPGRYTEEHHTLLWYFKNLVSAMTRFPEIPLDRTEAVLDDMARRWAEGGHSPQAVHAHRHYVARHVGDLAAAQEWYAQWCAAPRDSLSDCVGCDPSGKAHWLAGQGRDDEAIALAEPVLAGRLTCSEQPQGILVTLMLPYLRAGQLDHARDAFRKGYRLHSRHLADLAEIGDYLQFCALTGNATRGLEIVQRHLDWLDRAPSPYAAMAFAAGATAVLDQLAAGGHGGQPVRRPAGEVSVAELAANLRGSALSLAARFDTRNGTGHQGDRIRAVMAAEPMIDYLRLHAAGVTSATLHAAPPGARPESVAASANVDTANDWSVPDDLDADGLLDLAFEVGKFGFDEQQAACVEEFDRRFGSADLTVLQRAKRADLHTNTLRDPDQLAELELAMNGVIDLYHAAGDTERVQLARARYGMVLITTDQSERGLPLVTESTEWLVSHGPAERACAAYTRLGIALMLTGDLDGAQIQFEKAEQAAGPADESATYYLALRKAELAMRTGDGDGALASSAEAVRWARLHGPRNRATAYAVRGAVLTDYGQPDAAVALYDQALAEIRDPRWCQSFAAARASLLATSERAEEAIGPLVDAVADAVAAGDGPTAIRMQLKLATAYLNAQRPVDAAEVAEEAVAAATSAAGDESTVLTVELRHLLTEAYRRLNHQEEALAQLAALEELYVAYGDFVNAGRVAHQSGRLLEDSNRDTEAATRFLVAAEHHRQAGRDHLVVVSLRERALCLLWSGDHEAAQAQQVEVDRLADELDPTDERHRYEQAAVDFAAGKLLHNVGKYASAQQRVARSAARFRGLGAPVEAADCEQLNARMLRQLGEIPAAIEAVRRGLADLPPEHELAENLNDLLVELRDET